MTPRSGRLAIWCLALLLCLLMYLKGRVPAPTGGDAAFLRDGRGEVVVRLLDGFPRPGLHRLPEGATVQTVMDMTLPGVRVGPALVPKLPRRLESGDILSVSVQSGVCRAISLQGMGAGERILLGIPLNPDAMDAADWAAVPGIGAVLSRRICDDRHINGAFGSLEGVRRVRGMGAWRIEAVRKYF